MKFNGFYNKCFIFTCLLGVTISLYALFLEIIKEARPSYVPFCDVSETISCSKALMSRWSRGFGIVGLLLGEKHFLNIRNPVYGIFFYITLILLKLTKKRRWTRKVIFYLVVVSNIGSLYLAYLLYAVIHSLCLVCISIYVVNFCLLILLRASK
ncbi:Vitamin K epoxide reductase complex subunit 1-like protein 1 [Trichinella britovi]|uniref:vitamin-K-epoxide reductase (warfarin-sensitive) n=1 Tax=Trichinella britovi TaxID=45882 RepID=A0A0V1CUL9_TRIBR|nr:Vitamin K epoxide reductase complex subunit 1-like protein 1 [Trichinella britovi]